MLVITTSLLPVPTQQILFTLSAVARKLRQRQTLMSLTGILQVEVLVAAPLQSPLVLLLREFPETL